VLKLPFRAQQVAWADGLSRGATKAEFDPQWKDARKAVGRTPALRAAETLRYA
jgi:hypothetical protein